MLPQIKGLVSLVTGGGSGLGLDVCRRLAALGSRVVALDLKPSSEPIESVIPVKGDIRVEEDITRALNHCSDDSGENRLDVLVNCAGIANAFKIFNFEAKRAQRLEDFKELMEINVCGTFNTIRLSVELIAKNNPNSDGIRGVIINTSSILATDGHEGQTGYSSSQMAINSMTLPLARDLSSLGIRVNTIGCGFFATPLVERCDSPELFEFLRMTTPLPSRLGEPKEFSFLVQTLIENQMINGEVIRIDGACRWPERG